MNINMLRAICSMVVFLGMWPAQSVQATTAALPLYASSLSSAAVTNTSTVKPIAIRAVNPGYTVGGKSNSGEFIELVNLSDDEVDLTGVALRYVPDGVDAKDLYTFPDGSKFAGETLLLRYSGAPDVKAATEPYYDALYTRNVAQGGAIELVYRAAGAELGDYSVIDSVCFDGSGAAGCYEKFVSMSMTSLVQRLEKVEDALGAGTLDLSKLGSEDNLRYRKTGEFELKVDYLPGYDPENPGLQLAEESEPENGDTKDGDTDGSSSSSSSTKTLAPCKEGYERNPETNRCRKITTTVTTEDTATADTPQCQGLEFTEILSYYETDLSEQFIELHNPTQEDVSLVGCKIRYKNKSYALEGTIAAGEYYAYRPTGFRLTKNPTSENLLELIDVTAEVVAQATLPHGQKKGTAYAAFGFGADGKATWLITYLPTPGAENTYQEFRTCAEGKVINPDTGNCVKATTMSSTTAECPEGKYRNPLTGRCKAYETESGQTPCKEGYERNPETNRCRKVKENNGADYALVPITGVEEQSSFIAMWALIALAAAGGAYIVFQFRKEIGYKLKRLVGKFSKK